MASCFTNIVLDILFVILLQFGIAGAAFATIFSQCVSAFLVIFTLTHTQDLHRLVLSRLGLDTRMIKTDHPHRTAIWPSVPPCTACPT